MKLTFISSSIIIGILMLSSCARLDANLFNNAHLDSYKLDAYDGTKELPGLPATYQVADSMVHSLQLTSKSSSEGNETVYGFYIGDVSKIATDTVILYCHGNKHHIDNYWNRAKLLAHLGGRAHRYGVLIFDYRGYGMSTGKPTEEGMYCDVDAFMEWLKSKGLSNDRLFIYGYSLGTGAATHMTAIPRTLTPSRLILEAPFAGTDVMSSDATQLNIPAVFITNNKVDNAAMIQKVNQPFCWMHGTDDMFLNIKTHGEVVYKNYHGVFSEAHRIEKADHNNVPVVWGYENYLNAISTFITAKIK